MNYSQALQFLFEITQRSPLPLPQHRQCAEAFAFLQVLTSTEDERVEKRKKSKPATPASSKVNGHENSDPVPNPPGRA